MLRATVNVVKRLREKGELPYYKRRPVMLDAADVEKYLESGKFRQSTTPPADTLIDNNLSPRAWALAKRARRGGGRLGPAAFDGRPARKQTKKSP